MQRKVLIGGGTGFIGSYLNRHLFRQGYDVMLISRFPADKHITWYQLQQHGLPPGITYVVNLTGQNVLNPTRRWTEIYKQDVWNSRINSSSNLAKAIANSNDVKAFVNISGVSHYKPSDVRVYKEIDEVNSFDFMSSLCIDWEKAAKLPNNISEKVRSIYLRTGVVLGRDGGMIKSMHLPFMMGLGGPFGTGKQILPWIHIVDLCRLIQYCFECENCAGVLNAVAPEIVSNGEFCKTYAKALGRPCFMSVPKFIVQLLFGEDRASLLLTGAKIQPFRTLATGFEFNYPTSRAACEEIISNEKKDLLNIK